MNAHNTLNHESSFSALKKIEHPSMRQLKEFDTEILCNWLIDPDKWQKERFSAEIIQFIENSQGINAYPNMVLIGMLAHQIDLYVECTKQIAQKGLIEGYNKGATTGPSIYFNMADKALNRIIQIMKELGITPMHRIGQVKVKSQESIDIEAFLAGPF
jgi:hypothetical protein